MSTNKQDRFHTPSAVEVHFGGNTYMVPGGDFTLEELAAKLPALPEGVTAYHIAQHACHEYATTERPPRLYSAPLAALAAEPAEPADRKVKKGKEPKFAKAFKEPKHAKAPRASKKK